jgi:hypothetical protein
MSRPVRLILLTVALACAAVAVIVVAAVGPDDTDRADAASLRSDASRTFRSRPDLSPPKVQVYRSAGGTAPGSIFVAPKRTTGTKSVAHTGPLIVDNAGKPIWFRPNPAGTKANDFRVQEYKGKPVLTWWEGHARKGHGQGVGIIADTSYRVIKRVRAHKPYALDMHEFKLTPRGTALVIIYHETRRDLRSVGGPRRGYILDNIVQEIDLDSGKVLFSWHALGHVGLKESYRDLDEDDAGDPWDYFHINSVDVDGDGNYLISARYSNSVIKVSRRTGRIVWRLGGRRSDFKMGKGTRFHLAHDAEWVQDDRLLHIFDNSEEGVRTRSRLLTLRVDTHRKRVTLVRDLRHPKRILAATQGNWDELPNGDVFAEFGSQGRWSEFDPKGKLIYDAELPDGYDSYRGYRAQWHAQPTTRPALAVTRPSDGTTVVYASWNGATEVASWRVLGGGSPQALTPVGSSPRKGFETAITVPGRPAVVAVQALDASGRVLSQSLPK